MAQVDTILSWAKSMVGSNNYSGYCQRFVATAYTKAGLPYGDAGSARDACNRWKVAKSAYSAIPRGACVYFYSPKYPQWGHVGLSLGGDKIVHAFGKVKYGTASGLNASGYTYLGWGWNAGRQPTGTSGASGGSYDSGGYGGGSDSSESSAEPAVVHIPQTEKLYTAYEDDSRTKKTDDYKLVWKAYGGTAKDITDKVGSMQMTDDADSICTELNFSFLGVDGDRYFPVAGFACGDRVSVVNKATGRCVFSGMIENLTGTWHSGLAVRCCDDGRLLTENEVILQCNNIAAKTAISNLANKVGIGKVSIPNLISSVYETIKTDAASAIERILSTVTAENGVTYFCRVMGDTLVIRSYAKDCIVPWCRQAENVQAFKVLDNAEAPTVTHSIEELKNRINVYSEADSSVSVAGTAEDAESIAHYGLRTALESFSSETGVTASSKAKTLLAQKNAVQDGLTLTCFGSDAVMAGVRLKLNLREAGGEYHVKAVTHEYGKMHTMTLTLVKAV